MREFTAGVHAAHITEKFMDKLLSLNHKCVSAQELKNVEKKFFTAVLRPHVSSLQSIAVLL